MNKYWMYFGVMAFSLLSSSVHAVTVQWENSYHIGTEAGGTRLLVAELSAPATETVTIFFESEKKVMQLLVLIIRWTQVP